MFISKKELSGKTQRQRQNQSRLFYTIYSHLFCLDDGDRVTQSGNTTTTTTAYTHGPGMDEPLSLERNSQTYYYHADGLGSITSMTDSAQAAVNRYVYDSFGALKSSETIRNAYAYTGREYDSETGLYYYRARYYDPEAGRFVSKDPIGFGGGDVNLYGYVGNSPIKWIDPLGLSTAYYNRETSSVIVIGKNGDLQVMLPAGNKTTNPEGDPYAIGSNGPAPAGIFPVQSPINTSGQEEFGSYFWPIGARGPKGERLDIARERGIGLHCGRRGPDSKTQGCMRMQNDDCKKLHDLTKDDPLAEIYIYP